MVTHLYGEEGLSWIRERECRGIIWRESDSGLNVSGSPRHGRLRTSPRATGSNTWRWIPGGGRRRGTPRAADTSLITTMVCLSVYVSIDTRLPGRICSSGAVTSAEGIAPGPQNGPLQAGLPRPEPNHAPRTSQELGAPRFAIRSLTVT